MRNRQAIQNNLQFDLIKFISYTENELMNNRNLKQEKEQLESKNEELNYQIMTINSELMKLKNQINISNSDDFVLDEDIQKVLKSALPIIDDSKKKEDFIVHIKKWIVENL